MVYLDYAATTPIDSEALEVYQHISTQVFGNTTSLHDIGSEANDILQVCRRELSTLLNVSSNGIYFTSGGTESNLLSIISLAKSRSQHGRHIIVSMGEHASVKSAVKYLEEDGFIISEIPFTDDGMINMDILKQTIRDDTILISIQHINSEIGTIQPIEDIARYIHDRSIVLHCDCVQSFGKMDLKTITPYVDCVTISSHKIYGPKGVGAIYINPIHHIKPVFPGFHHEHGFRGGTINLPGIAAFIAAAKKSIQFNKQQDHFQSLRTVFLQHLFHQGDHSPFTVYESRILVNQLPHIIGLRIKGMEGQYVMLECNRKGFAISTGSACQVGQQEPSVAMKAMGIPAESAKEFIRISMGKDTKESDLISLAELLKNLAI